MGKNARLKRERKATNRRPLGDSTLPSVGRGISSGPETCGASSNQLDRPAWSTILFHITLLSLLTFATSIFPIESEDIFSNIVTGQYLWTNASIPETDPFSFTGPHRWVVNRAFPSIIFFGVHHMGGLPAIQLFCAGILTVTYSLLYAVWAKRTRRTVLSFGIVAVLILASCYWAQTRIYVFAYLYTVISILLITSPNPRAIWWTIPLQIAWINSHPSAILGIFLVGLWFVTKTWSQSHSIKKFSVPVILVIGANLLSPIGVRAYIKFAEEAFGEHPSRTNIFEWLSPFSPTVSSQHLASWFFGSCIVFALVLARQFISSDKTRSANILLPLALTFFSLAIGCARHIPLFYFALGSLLICAGESALRDRRNLVASNKRWIVHLISGLLVALIATKVMIYGYANGNAERHFAFGIDTHKFPDKAIEIIKTSKIEGNIFSDYDTGAYFLYRMYPDYKYISMELDLTKYTGKTPSCVICRSAMTNRLLMRRYQSTIFALSWFRSRLPKVRSFNSTSFSHRILFGDSHTLTTQACSS